MQMVNAYLKEKFNKKIFKISLDAGFTCPNRDGTCGNRGCIFCSGNGSGDFAEDRNLNIEEQLRRGKERLLAGKISKLMQNNERPAVGYIAYYQAFTNTYASVDKLKALYRPALEDREVVAISIATRPDCLPNEVCELLKEMNEIKPVWVELGLQTMHEQTAKYIRRGYELAVYDGAVKKLKEAGISHIITHVILGLPGESQADMLATVKYVCDSGADGIKLQLLHVLQGTDLAEEYEKGAFETLSFEEYTGLVVECLRILPENMVVHRITGDGPKDALLSPRWALDKKRVLNEIRHKAAQKGLFV